MGMECSMGSLWWGLAWRFAVVFGATFIGLRPLLCMRLSDFLHGWRGYWTNAVPKYIPSAGCDDPPLFHPPNFPATFHTLALDRAKALWSHLPGRLKPFSHWNPKDGSFSLGSALGSLPIGTWRTSPEPLPCRSFLPRRLGRPAERTWKEPRAQIPSDGHWMIWMEFHRSFDPHIFASWHYISSQNLPMLHDG